MEMADITTLEATGAAFEPEAFMAMRVRTRSALHTIAAQVQVGMPEAEAVEIARDVLKSLDLRRGWHRTLVRCGPNTTKDFMEKSEPGVVLGHNDIFFIDIGPIYEGTEGDAGETFVFGDDPDHLRAKLEVRTIWDDVRQVWFDERLTGVALYDFARKTASDRGWKLNMDLSGHRLSEFPHSAHYDGSLADVPFTPNPNLWVLEIAIAHPDRPFGAFYEDLLLEDQSFPG